MTNPFATVQETNGTAPKKGGKPIDVPDEVKPRLDRAKNQIRVGSSTRNECVAMWEGDQYVQRHLDGYLVSSGTVVGDKPAHRPRRKRNLIQPMVQEKVSSATSRIPAYEINPTTTDPEDIQAAHLAGKVMASRYDTWNISRVSKEVVTSALVMDGGYAMPFWDASVGPYLDGGVGVGEVGIRTYTGNEVGWEPGVKFHESKWHVIMQARPIDEVTSLPGFIKIDGDVQLSPDAAKWEVLRLGSNKSIADAKLVMVTDYIERPSQKYQQGRRLVIANDRIILPEEPYPCAEYGFDGLALHPLTYIVHPDSDRDMGMVFHMLDAQRTYNKATNMQEAWAQLALNPQIIGPPMANKIKFTDEPGAYYTVVPINGMVPQWREVPPIPPELSQMKVEAKTDMMLIAAFEDLDNIQSGKQMQVAIEQSRQRWQAFMSDVAAFHSSLGRHCLQLVQHYYTEPRMVKIRGRFGWENIDDFRGADLRDQTDVTVLPGSIEPRTRASVQQYVQWICQTFPGYVSPEAALAAIEGGAGEKLIEGYELDVARANLMLQKICAGPAVFMAQPLQLGTDPMTGMPYQEPAWAPREFDNVAVHMTVFADYMKTPDFDLQGPDIQGALRMYYDGCKALKMQHQLQEQAMQSQMASGLGMANAAKPAGPTPMPSLPAPANVPGA